MVNLKLGSLVVPLRRSFSSSHLNLSGHNKWSKIKQKKGANDAQKGVVFGKTARDIVAAARNGGSIDPTKNLQLAAVLKRAKELDVPKENIEKALAKASQGKDHSGNTFIYEALAFSTVGLIIECATDNNNRTIHNLREILNDYGARAAPVKFMFERVGYVTAQRTAESLPPGFRERSSDELVEKAFDYGANDFGELNSGDESVVAYWFKCPPDRLHPLTNGIQDQCKHWSIGLSELRYVSSLEDSPEEITEEVKNGLGMLIEELESNEDVIQVWSSLQQEEE